MWRAVQGAFLPGLLLCCSTALAEPQQPDRSPDPPPHRRGRLNRGLEEHGYHFELDYSADLFSIVSGGLHRESGYVHNVDFILRIDGQRAMGWKGMTLQIYGLNIAGQDPGIDAGVAQDLSNIAAPAATRLYELWLQQNLGGDRVSLRAGLYDLNTEFDVIPAAGVFLNASHGIDPTFSQSGLNGPSIFPYTTLAFRARFKPTRGTYIQSALLNGVAGDPDDPRGTHLLLGGGNGILSTTEVGVLFNSHARTNPPVRRAHRRAEGLRRALSEGRVAAGLWFYTSPFDRLLPSSDVHKPSSIRGRPGLYALAEQRVLGSDAESDQGLKLFGRIGLADSRIYRFGSYLGAGLVYTGLTRGRPRDQLGLAVAMAKNGQDYRTAQARAGNRVFGSEWNLELTYFANLGRWLSLQPDLQYVIHPNTDPSVHNALALDLRIEISLP